MRIQFSADDVARVRVAGNPDPMWEILLSLHMLQVDEGAMVFGEWRRQVRSNLPRSARLLLDLAPPSGYSPDFLTPATGSPDVDAALDRFLATPGERVVHDLSEFAAEHPLAPWMRSLINRDPDILRVLAGALRDYYQTALGTYWKRIRNAIEADREQRARVLSGGGPGVLLGSLHPELRWRAATLSMPGAPEERNVPLAGRGLLLVPSFFCWGKPIMLRDPTLPPVLVYPIAHTPGWTEQDEVDTDPRKLAALLGRTRAAMLSALATGELTTGDLARILRISPATASEHVTVLRNAGLTATHRVRNTARHTVLPLGADLLAGTARAIPDTTQS